MLIPTTYGWALGLLILTARLLSPLSYSLISQVMKDIQYSKTPQT